MYDLLLAHGVVLLFAAVTGFPWLVERNRQIFQPIKLWSLPQIALVAPAALLVAYNPHNLHPDVCVYCRAGAIPALIDTLLVFTGLNIAIQLGYYAIVWRSRKRKVISPHPLQPMPFDHPAQIGLLALLALAGFVIEVSAAGGLGFVQDNITQRTALQAGLGPLNFLVDVLFIAATILALRRFALEGSRFNLLVVLAVVGLSVGTATLFGGRKASLQLLLTIFMLFSLYRPGFLPMSLKTLPVLAGLYLLVMLYFGAVLIYRSAPGSPTALAGAGELFGHVFGSMAEMLLSMSYLDHYIFIVSAFDSDTYYYGATFQDLATSFLPSTLVPDKPPVDDGLYVRVATLGGRLEPGTPAHLLQGLASWPGETLGTGYMNGGAGLVLAFGLLQGLAMGWSYRLASRFPNGILWPLMLCHVMLNFKISNLRITNLVATLVATLLVVALVRFIALFITPPPGSKPNPEADGAAS